ncbi:hypothetical protein BDQ12DRAFT_117647 [Crucibulum laeve]|uniref:Uncharacterized protein n=1 Tax=Crucibulum laeve TaxID=68775 RepID=A0A5C3LFD8_9AGAR|nr:hypothetical protein BDQ12DRAFT_117647 [Crucibulum laeve]
MAAPPQSNGEDGANWIDFIGRTNAPRPSNRENPLPNDITGVFATPTVGSGLSTTVSDARGEALPRSELPPRHVPAARTGPDGRPRSRPENAAPIAQQQIPVKSLSPTPAVQEEAEEEVPAAAPAPEAESAHSSAASSSASAAPEQRMDGEKLDEEGDNGSADKVAPPSIDESDDKDADGEDADGDDEKDVKDEKNEKDVPEAMEGVEGASTA